MLVFVMLKPTESQSGHIQKFLRMTAKSTLFGKKTFSSWLIESSGALPLQRKIDFAEGTQIDNTHVMNKLYEALENGDTIGLFPEGMSRYRSGMAPLKTGVARVVSEVLTRRKDDPNYELTLVTCSITYMHRQHFRSDVLITFHPPIKFRPQVRLNCSVLVNIPTPTSIRNVPLSLHPVTLRMSRHSPTSWPHKSAQVPSTHHLGM